MDRSENLHSTKNKGLIAKAECASFTSLRHDISNYLHIYRHEVIIR